MTSEYVTLGHPDKTADYISEYILDEYMKRDPLTRYAVEVQIKDNWVSLAGEVTSKADITAGQRAEFVRDAIREIGYTAEYAGTWPEGAALNADEVEVAEHMSQQSPDISRGVDADGWGDQGIFWGMAVDDDAHDCLPLDYWTARRIGDHLYERRFGGLDVKTQVTTENGKPVDCVVAVPLRPENESVARKVIEHYARSVVGDKCRVTVNGTGRYVTHSSMGDCGTTGRKLAVDFYGGNCRIGGGSPWTKDPSKADLTLNVYARKLALDFVKAHKIPEARVQISCCIGQRRIAVDVYDARGNALDKYVEFRRPREIIAELGLDRACYKNLCKAGIAAWTYRRAKA